MCSTYTLFTKGVKSLRMALNRINNHSPLDLLSNSIGLCESLLSNSMGFYFQTLYVYDWMCECFENCESSEYCECFEFSDNSD